MSDKIELNKIYNENCLVGMQRMEDHSVDMVLCDLPYGSTRNKWDCTLPLLDYFDYKGYRFSNEYDLRVFAGKLKFDPEPFRKLGIWSHYNRILKPNGAIVLTAAQPFTSVLISSNLSMFKYSWVWEKPNGTGHLNAKKQPLRSHEDICVFYKKQPTYNPQMEIGEPYQWGSKRTHSTNYHAHAKNDKIVNNGERYPKTVLRFKQERGLHPTQKPVDLFEYLIETYTNEGEVVLDNCMGSGTTAVACLRTNRQFIGFENDIKHGYYQTSQLRIEQTIAAMERERRG